MRRLENINIVGSDGKDAPSSVKKKLAILLASFDLCVNGNGLPEEAMEIAGLLSVFFKENSVSNKPGFFLPDWADALVKFYLASGSIGMAVKAAAIRGKPLDDKEMEIYRQALAKKKEFRLKCAELAEMLSQSGMLTPAAVAARLAGQDLGEENLLLIRQQLFLGNIIE